MALVAVLFFSLMSLAQMCLAQEPAQAPPQGQDQPAADQQNSPAPQMQANNQRATITIPAGTRFALVLTQPVQSRSTRRGDDIYAQVSSPVDAGNEVVIPPGTFFQGQVDKVSRESGRGELRLQSASVTFPDGYVAPISGPLTLETPDGYALRDPGPNRGAAAFLLPLGGAGLGALIGHSVGGSSSTITSTLPPGCTGPPPNCLTSSATVPGNSARNAIIGAGIGGVAGFVASFAVIGSSRHFFLDVGAPAEMTLQQPVTLQQDEVAKAVQQSGQSQVAVQPVMPRPVPYVPPPPAMPSSSGTCWTPGTPGTPSTTIPGPPGPGGIPGPPTIIPGTPGTPPTPYPCP